MQILFSGSEDENLNNKIWTLKLSEIKEGGDVTCRDVINYVFKYEPRSHRSFFKHDGSLAGGTICLFEDQDLDIINQDAAIVKEDSTITFISTMHGG